MHLCPSTIKNNGMVIFACRDVSCCTSSILSVSMPGLCASPCAPQAGCLGGESSTAEGGGCGCLWLHLSPLLWWCVLCFSQQFWCTALEALCMLYCKCAYPFSGTKALGLVFRCFLLKEVRYEQLGELGGCWGCHHCSLWADPHQKPPYYTIISKGMCQYEQLTKFYQMTNIFIYSPLQKKPWLLFGKTEHG